MAFQFQCPQGHLLEGDESQAGQTCTCPICQVLFLIPPPLEAAPVQAEPEPAPPPPAAPESPPELPPAPKPLHIPCPQGHELEVPLEMLGQLVACPHCGEQFTLRERDSVEWKRKYALQQEQRWRRTGQFWLNLSIVFAVLVVLGLLLLIAMSS